MLINLLSATKSLPELDNYSAIHQMHVTLEQFFFAMASGQEKDKRDIQEKFDIFYSKFVLQAYESPRSHDFLKGKAYRDVMAALIQDVEFFQKNMSPLGSVTAEEKTKIIEEILAMRGRMLNLSNVAYETQINQYQGTLNHLFWNRAMALAIYVVTVICSGILLFVGMRYKQIAKESAETVRMKNLFVSAVNHELRPPIQSLVHAAKALSMKVSEKDTVLIDILNRATEKIVLKMREFGDYSRLEINKIETSNEKFLVSDLLDDASKNFSHAATAKGIDFNVKNACDEDEVNADRLHIQQILALLIGNAIKFTNEGEIVVSAMTGKKNGRDVLVFDIADTGVGIGVSDLSKIFDPFFQINNNLNNAGSGLGLTMVKQMTTLLKGDISVRSKEGKGTTFTVQIPVGFLTKKKTDV
ncbi:sensor histidine kinase KdpD [Herbaspirillum sp. RV1423]|uniref:sensor histidine kinase n=1 Tax=Herbaspirillum sp. RV1423 TaxID=1443993 RepID=UPI0018CC6289|nr:HAMP domain-containing sensor histidine kinase [Herbaspirillum sp. RV1423]